MSCAAWLRAIAATLFFASSLPSAGQPARASFRRLRHARPAQPDAPGPASGTGCLGPSGNSSGRPRDTVESAHLRHQRHSLTAIFCKDVEGSKAANAKGRNDGSVSASPEAGGDPSLPHVYSVPTRRWLPQSDQPNKCAACVIAAPARMAAATTAVSASCASVAPAFRASWV